MLLKITLCLSALSIATSAVAQTPKKARIEKPTYAQAESDTLTMT